MLCMVITTYAQNTLSGRVTDEATHEPLIGAGIYIHDLKTGAMTDANGMYRITRLPKGKFLVEIKYPSYAGKVTEVTIAGDQQLDFTLAESVAELHEVVVTGVSSATQARINPVPTTIISKEALLEQSSTNIIDALSRKPGIAQITTGAAISKPNIRGLGYNRVVTLYNGLRQEGQQWGDEHGIEIDEYSIDHAEVIKGPGTLMYGSDALAGVVNLLTPVPLPEGKMSGSVLTSYQTNNHLIGYSLMNEGNVKGVNWQLRYSGKDAGNYRNAYDGTVYNSGFKEWDVNGHVGLSRKWGYTQLHFTSFNQTIAMPEGERDANGNFTRAVTTDSAVTVSNSDLQGYRTGVPYQQISHQRLFLVNQFILGKCRLALTGGYQLNERKEFGDPEQTDVYSLYFYLPTWNYDVKFFLPEWRGWKASAGMSGMYQQNQNKGSEFLIPDYRLSDIGGFAFVQKTAGRWFISGGMRYDTRSIQSDQLPLDSSGQASATGTEKFKALDLHFQNYSASAGVSYQLSTALTAKANIARGYRAPNIAELASNGRHEGTFRYEIGNPLLKPETSLQFDLGLEYISDHFTVELNVFDNAISNYIYAARLPYNVTDEEEPDVTIPAYIFGQGRANLYGGELSIDLHPHPLDWLHFENSFSLVRGLLLNQPDSSKYLPFIPAPRIQSELRANRKKMGNYLQNLYVKLDLDYYFRQDQYLQENQTETATPAYLLLHAGAGTDIGRKGKKWFSLYIQANNLLDAAYQNHLSRLKYAPVNPATGRQGIYNMGRNVSVKLLIPIAFR